MKSRSCSAGYPISLYRAPYGVMELQGIGLGKIDERFCVVSHNVIICKTNSFPEAEKALVAECKKYHKKNEACSGRMKIGKMMHKDGILKPIKVKVKTSPGIGG